MLEKIAEINGSINGVVWGIFGLALLIGTGVITTLLTKVFQVMTFTEECQNRAEIIKLELFYSY